MNGLRSDLCTGPNTKKGSLHPSTYLIAIRSPVLIVERLRYSKDVITIDIPFAAIAVP